MFAPARILARVRVPLGFVFGALAFWLSTPTGSTLRIGLAIAVVGEALRLWAAGHLNKSREVTSSGPYRWMAHPLYVGSSIMGLGLAVASRSGSVAVLVALYLGATLIAAVRTEEAFLRGRFGDDYDRYRTGEAVVGARERRFSLRRAIGNREHRAMGGLLAAALLLVWKATYNGLFWRAAGSDFVKPGG